MVKVIINPERCKGCGLCIEVCPNRMLRLSASFNALGTHFVEADADIACSGCRRCAIICPDVAIELYEMEQENKTREEGKGGKP